MSYFLIAVIMIALLVVLYEIRDLKDKNKELELRINLLLEDSGNNELSTLYVSEELKNKLRELKNNGKYVEAVRVLRQNTTYDLLGAKTYVDNLN